MQAGLSYISGRQQHVLGQAFSQKATNIEVWEEAYEQYMCKEGWQSGVWPADWGVLLPVEAAACGGPPHAHQPGD